MDSALNDVFNCNEHSASEEMVDLIMKHDDMDVEIVCSVGSAHSPRSS